MRKAGIDFGLTNVKAHWRNAKDEEMFLSTAEVSRASLASALAHSGITDLCAAGNGPTDGFEGFRRHRPPGDPLTAEIRTQAEGARRLLESSGSPPPDRHHVVSIGTGTSYALRMAAGTLVPLLGSAVGAGMVDGLMAARAYDAPRIDALLASEPDGASFDLMLAEAVPSLRGTPFEAYTAAHFAKAARSADALDQETADRLYASSAVNVLVVDVARSLLLHDRNPACRLVPDAAVADVIVLGMLPARSCVVRRRLDTALRMIGKNPIFPERAEYALAIGAYHAIDLDP